MLKTSFLFDRWGSGRSGFHMRIEGRAVDGQPLMRHEWIVARSGQGPNIPCMPAILLAKRLARGETLASGARACVGIIGLDEFLTALDGLDIDVLRQ